MSKNVTLLETVYTPVDRIDKEAGVIQGVKILGKESVNNRTYSDEALNDAARLYEGVEVNVDHDRKDPRRERGLLEGFGVIRNAKRQSDGVYGDLHYLTKHPAVPLFLERIDKKMPIGLSHNADGRQGTRGGKVLVESISKVRSVDVVRTPATCESLFESKDQTVKTTIKAIIESAFPKTAKGSLLLEDAMGAMPVETPEAGSSDDQIKAAFEAAVVAAFRDDTLDSKATLKKIKDILNAYDKLNGSGDKPADSSSSGEGDGAPTVESKDPTVATLQNQITLMESREKCRDLLESSGVKSSPIRLKSLAPLNDDERKELIAEWKTADGSTGRPRTAAPLYESKDDADGKIPTDGKKFAALCR